MPYKRSGRAGGKSVSMIGMLVLLLAALLVLPSCFDDETVTVDRTQCDNGTVATAPDTCPDLVGAPGTTPERPVCHATAMPGVLLPGGAPNDALCGSEGDDMIEGNGGDDTITGNGGDDNPLSGGQGDDMIAGNAGDDTLIGGPGEDTLEGGADDDTLNGGPGNDIIDGGEGSDTAVYERAVAETPLLPVEANLATGQAEDGFYGRDTLRNIENLSGGEDPDTFIGNDNANTLTGGGGDDTLSGGGGDDTLNGGPGADTLDGGEGSDTATYKDSADGVTVSLVVIEDSSDDTMMIVTVPIGGEAANDVFKTTTIKNDDDEDVVVSSIENITGSPLADTLTGDSGANTINGGGGNDTISGGGGNDIINAGAGDDTNVEGGMGNDMLKGGPGADELDGNEGDDHLYGNDDGETVATDTLNGGSGNDIYFPSIASDGTTDIIEETVANDPNADPPVVTEDKAVYFMYYVKPMEDVDPPAPTLALPLNVEVLHGTRYNDMITSANGGTLLGHEGNDTFMGSTNAETFVGCAGNDTYTGGGGGDVFGIVNTGEGSGVDIIADFSGDEIHIKGYDSEVAVATSVTPGTAQVELRVGGVLLAVVQDTDADTDGAALKKALDADGVIVFDTMFDATSNKCVSPDPMM